jgi:hypothetical protein
MNTIFWDITPRSRLRVNRRLGGTYRLHLQGQISILKMVLFYSVTSYFILGSFIGVFNNPERRTREKAYHLLERNYL